MLHDENRTDIFTDRKPQRLSKRLYAKIVLVYQVGQVYQGHYVGLVHQGHYIGLVYQDHYVGLVHQGHYVGLVYQGYYVGLVYQGHYAGLVVIRELYILRYIKKCL